VRIRAVGLEHAKQLAVDPFAFFHHCFVIPTEVEESLNIV
jgi:hypothetical protein